MAVKKATTAKKDAPARKTAPATKATTAKVAPATRKALPARKAVAAKPVPAKKAAVGKSVPVKAVAARVAAAKPVPAKKAAPTRAAATRSAAKTATKGATTPVSRSATRKTAKAAATKAAAPLQAHKAAASTSRARPKRLRVREDETPWTAKELKAVRAELEADIARLQDEILVAESDLAGLMRDAGDGAGDDQADAGTKTFEREQEISLVNNAREMFEQSQHALQRIVDGSYGICESCSKAIGKNRLLAFPRATLCLPCKSKQERR